MQLDAVDANRVGSNTAVGLPSSDAAPNAFARQLVSSNQAGAGAACVGQNSGLAEQAQRYATYAQVNDSGPGGEAVGRASGSDSVKGDRGESLESLL